MRLGRVRCALCGVALVCMIIGTPLVIYGGVTQPMSLTKEEAWAAGTHQQEALADKQAASPARLQMFVGLGFALVSVGSLLSVWCITVALTFVTPEPEPGEEGPEEAPQPLPQPLPTPSNEGAQSPPNGSP